ncbi:hypothetical protein NEOLEDRAFT_152659 [Neolentinus lepideus HHB14362 ss-1]|uniref:Uncharacterized protein n=1 Tax=Neolentinus lepideus HHB14362 ss-1 TaxID=1314782 RepID=A0A165MM12_9AGAM|nr:hypothetical protein NEOLEDRAFT_152659 [Neolentinus lepideus HHB14362 ss-1]
MLSRHLASSLCVVGRLVPPYSAPWQSRLSTDITGSSERYCVIKEPNSAVSSAALVPTASLQHRLPVSTGTLPNHRRASTVSSATLPLFYLIRL